MPHMTIRENIVLVPKLLKWSKEKKDAKAKELIKLVDLPEDYLDRYPSELSGGQQQHIWCRTCISCRARYHLNG